MTPCVTFFSVSGLFHLTQCPPGSSTILQMTAFLSFRRIAILLHCVDLHPTLKLHHACSNWLHICMLWTHCNELRMQILLNTWDQHTDFISSPHTPRSGICWCVRRVSSRWLSESCPPTRTWTLRQRDTILVPSVSRPNEISPFQSFLLTACA